MTRKRRWYHMLLNERGFIGPEEEEEDVIEEEEEEEDGEDKKKEGLEIDLDEGKKKVEDAEEDDVVEEEEEEEEPKPSSKRKKNKIHAQDRIITKLQRENELLRKQQTSSVTPANAQPAGQPYTGQVAYNPNDPRTWTDDQWDAYAKKDWKGAIDLRAKINAQDVVQQQTETQKASADLEVSKKTVGTRHPELHDDSSEKSRIYLQILDENPRYLTDPKGPIHAMRDMEDRMRELGYPEKDIVAAEKRGIRKEQDRQSRVAITSTKGRHTSSSGRKVQLSAEDLEFCKFHNMDPKEFAKSKHKLENAKGGLQV